MCFWLNQNPVNPILPYVPILFAMAYFNKSMGNKKINTTVAYK